MFYYSAKITKLIQIPLRGRQGTANAMADGDIALLEIKSYIHNHVCLLSL